MNYNTFNELEKLAFIQFYLNKLGSYMCKVAVNLGPVMGAAKAPTLMNRLTSAAPHINEVAGLGILAAPSVASLSGNPMSEHSSHLTELAGLGVLAGPSAYHAIKELKPAKSLIRA